MVQKNTKFHLLRLGSFFTFFCVRSVHVRPALSLILGRICARLGLYLYETFSSTMEHASLKHSAFRISLFYSFFFLSYLLLGIESTIDKIALEQVACRSLRMDMGGRIHNTLERYEWLVVRR